MTLIHFRLPFLEALLKTVKVKDDYFLWGGEHKGEHLFKDVRKWDVYTDKAMGDKDAISVRTTLLVIGEAEVEEPVNEVSQTYCVNKKKYYLIP